MLDSGRDGLFNPMVASDVGWIRAAHGFGAQQGGLWLARKARAPEFCPVIVSDRVAEQAASRGV